MPDVILTWFCFVFGVDKQTPRQTQRGDVRQQLVQVSVGDAIMHYFLILGIADENAPGAFPPGQIGPQMNVSLTIQTSTTVAD